MFDEQGPYNLLAVGTETGKLIARSYLTRENARTLRKIYEAEDYSVKIVPSERWDTFGEGFYEDWDDV